MRVFAIALAGSVCVASPAFAQAAAPAAQPQMPAFTTDTTKLPLVFAVGITVSDMARSVRFYREAMGAKSAAQRPSCRACLHCRLGLAGR